MAGGRIASDPADAYLPIFETLSWAVAIDERLATDLSSNPDIRDWSWRKRVPGGEVVAGFRFARNRAHHQWADVLYVTPGALLPTPLPFGFFEWRWRPTLPGGLNRHGEEAYAAYLADVPARFTLERLRGIFGDAIEEQAGSPPA